MLVPAALPVNVVLVLLANGLLVMALPKILLACLPWVLPDQLAAALMDAFVEAIRALVTCGSSPAGSWAVPSPPLPLTVVYYASLFAALAPRVPRSWRCAAMAMAAGLLALASWAPWHRPALALVWGADCDVPVVAIERPDGLPPLVLHSGTPEALRALLSWLQLRGHRRRRPRTRVDLRRAVGPPRWPWACRPYPDRPGPTRPGASWSGLPGPARRGPNPCPDRPQRDPGRLPRRLARRGGPRRHHSRPPTPACQCRFPWRLVTHPFAVGHHRPVPRHRRRRPRAGLRPGRDHPPPTMPDRS